MRPEAEDIFEPVGSRRDRYAIYRPADEEHARNRIVVVETRGDPREWPPQKLLARFPLGPMIQASRIPLGGRSVLVCELLADRAVFRAINLESLSYEFQFPVPGTYPQSWPIGLDVDDSGRFGLFAWADDDRVGVCIYDSRRRGARYLDCTDLRDRDIADVRWANESSSKLDIHDVVNGERVRVPVIDYKIHWPSGPVRTHQESAVNREEPPTNGQSTSDASAQSSEVADNAIPGEQGWVRRPKPKASPDEHSLNSSTLPE